MIPQQIRDDIEGLGERGAEYGKEAEAAWQRVRAWLDTQTTQPGDDDSLAGSLVDIGGASVPVQVYRLNGQDVVTLYDVQQALAKQQPGEWVPLSHGRFTRGQTDEELLNLDAVTLEVAKEGAFLSLRSSQTDYVVGFSLLPELRLCRRTQPAPQMPRPDWNDAPDWAQFWCLDARSFGIWSQNEPILVNGEWMVRGGKREVGHMGSLAFGLDYRQSMQRRPEANHEP